MALRTQVAGAWQPVTRLSVRIASQWRPLRSLKVMRDGVWREVATFVPEGGGGGGGPAQLSVTISSDTAEGFKSGIKPEQVVTSYVTVTPMGGAVPYNYAWSRISGDASITATDPTLATTAFRALLTSGSKNAVFRCVVTSAGQTASADVFVSIEADQ